MPKTGYKSITIPTETYDRFKTYKDTDGIKTEMGAYSLSKYVSYMLEERMMRDKMMAESAPMLKKIGIDDDRILLRDRKENRIVEVVVQQGKLHCELCDADDCIHCGFCLAMPEVYAVMKSKGS
ncbi:MAG: hypothetical protein F4Y82_02780 [Cenarchaeum sp. SB0665_bin_23]|nr:hypothetical protein [Cenarchaeum sp. SB0667_bin_13]MXY61025.1 hypothetical protein [Cenarchaeum sp. SB0665_bin_23]MXZ94041.1 hypothetical protein [Cenarchaeum sp. SB0666_bin_15]MYB47082.1 hypothetical protein [Cenarchaeum sp. SB0662_bin_33]MYC78893.1 hypothetical protein [Cenarchaeum sp. SB0661_bin_35]MYG32963.1 hypothetical protein [Cenarchaeum sp. SB0677_bin_16]MYJ27330.1 hypothetical protein [Cenarchaeum sp. SB0672_bin_9]